MRAERGVILMGLLKTEQAIVDKIRLQYGDEIAEQAIDFLLDPWVKNLSLHIALMERLAYPFEDYPDLSLKDICDKWETSELAMRRARSRMGKRAYFRGLQTLLRSYKVWGPVRTRGER